MATDFVAYYRVSTQRQGHTGLGLDAQRLAVQRFLPAIGGAIRAEFTEVESGTQTNRPELTAALVQCRATGATLLIAKLDRLARNVAFIANLIESGVRFVAADMPNADRFMLHVYAAVAEEEARRISERTRAALAAAKARGVRLGRTSMQLAETNRVNANRFAARVAPIIDELISTTGLSYRAAADRLNVMGVPSARRGRWHAASVHRVHNRLLRAQTQDQHRETS